MAWLLLGNALCVPIGVALLAWLPETSLRLVIGSLLLAAALAMRRTRGLALEATPAMRLLAGCVSGLANGLAAIGGIAVATMLSATHITPAAFRATLIVLFLATDLYALAWAALLSQADATPLLGIDTLRWALWFTPAMMAGVWVGQRKFGNVEPAAFRRHVLNLLTLIAALVVARAMPIWTG